MGIEEQIQSLLKEAAVYDAQGLYEESRQKYTQVADLVKRHAHHIHHHKKILNAVSSRLERLHNSIQRMENKPITYTSPDIVIDVMKRHFSSSQDREQAALEGAMTLAEFGQYESAIEEFARLIKNHKTRLEASKNMIRCHLAIGRTTEAAALIRHWRNSGLMARDEMIALDRYVQDLVEDRQLCLELPLAEMNDRAPEPALELSTVEAKRAGIVRNFKSISLKPPNARRGQGMREFDILSQSDDIIRVLVPVHETAFTDGLTAGTLLDRVLCFSADEMFSGKATVVGKQQILSGADAGHFNIDIRIQDG